MLIVPYCVYCVYMYNHGGVCLPHLVPPPQALVEAQQQFRDYIPGFTFNLGFCGQYYCKGTGGSVEGTWLYVHVVLRIDGFCWRRGKWVLLKLVLQGVESS